VNAKDSNPALSFHWALGTEDFASATLKSLVKFLADQEREASLAAARCTWRPAAGWKMGLRNRLSNMPGFQVTQLFWSSSRVQ
jgi:hypothetical protein